MDYDVVAEIMAVCSNGVDMSVGTGLLRETIGKLASALLLIVPLGLSWVLFDKENQERHDKIADTKLIRVR